MGVALEERPVLDDTGTDNPENVAHIIDQFMSGNSVSDAYVFGTELVAMCGYRWIPYRMPESLPLCKACKTALEGTT